MSEILGIGVDLCSIDRIRVAIENISFLERFYTQVERDYLSTKGRQKASSAAAMFAAKEAAAKALGTGFAEGIMPEQISVGHYESGAPFLTLSGEAQKHFLSMGASQILISISHEENMAIAYVTIQ